jgi:hypothetical protein
LRGKRFAIAVCLAGTLTIAGFGMQASHAFASSSNGATNSTIHCDPSNPQCGPFPGAAWNPAITTPLPTYVTIAPNCPSLISSGTWTLDFVSGNAVSHQTSNKNGGWGGASAEGPAVLTATSDGAVQYSGHLQNRGNSGNNSLTGNNQSVNDFTLDFNGSGTVGSISIHVNNHVTTDNSGAVTSLFETGSISCS